MPENQTTSTTRLLKQTSVLSKCALSKSELYRRLKAGTFPKPLRQSARAVAWRESDVDAWIASLPEVGK